MADHHHHHHHHGAGGDHLRRKRPTNTSATLGAAATLTTTAATMATTGAATAATVAATGATVTSPCGACKFLRRKCTAGCIFAPHFASDQGAARFAAVHKVFGASNVSKLLHHIPMNRRHDAVVTISYEAQARLSDPVYGCVSTIIALQNQVATLQAELTMVQNQLMNNRYAAMASAAFGTSQQYQRTTTTTNNNNYENNNSNNNNNNNIDIMIGFDVFQQNNNNNQPTYSNNSTASNNLILNSMDNNANFGAASSYHVAPVGTPPSASSFDLLQLSIPSSSQVDHQEEDDEEISRNNMAFANQILRSR